MRACGLRCRRELMRMGYSRAEPAVPRHRPSHHAPAHRQRRAVGPHPPRGPCAAPVSACGPRRLANAGLFIPTLRVRKTAGPPAVRRRWHSSAVTSRARRSASRRSRPTLGTLLTAAPPDRRTNGARSTSMRACMQVLALLEAVFAKMEPALAQVVPSCFDDLTGVKRKLRYGTASHRRPRAAVARELRVHAAVGRLVQCSARSRCCPHALAPAARGAAPVRRMPMG